jgi:hypothetical protein
LAYLRSGVVDSQTTANEPKDQQEYDGTYKGVDD